MNTNKEKNETVYKIMIDNKPYDWNNQFINRSEILTLGNIPSNYDVFLKINGPGEDEKIENNTIVDLSKPGREHFYSCKPNTNNG